MEKKSKLMLLAGVAAGAATAYYLTTPKGKELREKVAKKAKNAAEITTNKANEVTEVVKDKVATLSNTISDTKNAVVDKAATVAVNQLGNIESGISKAKSKLQNGVTK